MSPEGEQEQLSQCGLPLGEREWTQDLAQRMEPVKGHSLRRRSPREQAWKGFSAELSLSYSRHVIAMTRLMERQPPSEPYAHTHTDIANGKSEKRRRVSTGRQHGSCPGCTQMFISRAREWDRSKYSCISGRISKLWLKTPQGNGMSDQYV